MHFATVLSALGCALATAYLVFIEGWDAIRAGLTVAGSVMGICGMLLVILWAVAAPEDRAEFARSAFTAMRGDLDDLLRMLRLIR